MKALGDADGKSPHLLSNQIGKYSWLELEKTRNRSIIFIFPIREANDSRFLGPKGSLSIFRADKPN